MTFIPVWPGRLPPAAANRDPLEMLDQLEMMESLDRLVPMENPVALDRMPIRPM